MHHIDTAFSIPLLWWSMLNWQLFDKHPFFSYGRETVLLMNSVQVHCPLGTQKSQCSNLTASVYAWSPSLELLNLTFLWVHFLQLLYAWSTHLDLLNLTSHECTMFPPSNLPHTQLGLAWSTACACSFLWVSFVWSSPAILWESSINTCELVHPLK